MKVFIIDDEKIALNHLAQLLTKYENLEVVGKYSNPLNALSDFKLYMPDIVFTDIEMPGINGITLAKQISTLYPKCQIIFTTAYDEYAIKAFDLNACDYLLKPFAPDRLDKCVEKLTRNKNTPKEPKLPSFSLEPTTPFGKIVVYQNDELLFIDIDDITYLTASGKSIHIYTSTNEFISNKTLSYFEEKLTASNFYRCHKSYLINLNKITKLTPTIGYSWEAFLTDCDQAIPVSRYRASHLKELMLKK